MPAKTAKNNADTYQQSYNAAMDELADLMAEREEIDERREKIDRRISRLREAIVGLGVLNNKGSFEIAREHPELFPETAPTDVGFTDAVRNVFREYKEYTFSPVEMRDYLQFGGFDIAKYKNVLASIHSILKRLHKKNEVVEVTRDGKVVYKCNPRGPLATDPPKQEQSEPEISDDDIPF